MPYPQSLRRVLPRLAGTAIALVLASAPLRAEEPAKTVATVNGVAITTDDVAVIASDLGGGLPQMTQEQRDEYFTGFAIDMRLAVREAERLNITKPEDVERRLAYFRQKILMEAYLTHLAEQAASEDAMRKLYDEEVGKKPPEEEVRARHILLPTEEEAKAALERVRKGEDFAIVAKELSKDPGSSDGGDLGWFTKERMVPEFSAAAFALKPGDVSEPVKSQFGWHVIKLEERRARPVPTFEQVKTQIADYLVRKAQSEAIQKLRAEAKIERANAAPAAPAPAPAEPPKQ